jgi:two-component system chemotaxis sensor kinase CheA
MGDGRVALILDVLGLAQKAAVVSDAGKRRAAEAATQVRATDEGVRQTLLLFQLGLDRRMAIPLSMVARLEEFPRSSVERAGAHQVVQYRGRLLPMLRLAEMLGETAAPEARDPIQVVVYHHDGRDLGLVVENILDIVEENLTIHRRVGGGSVSGTAVIQGKVTDLLDVRAVIDGADVLHFAAASADEPQLAGV